MIPMVSTIGYASVPYLQSRKTVRPARQQQGRKATTPTDTVPRIKAAAQPIAIDEDTIPDSLLTRAGRYSAPRRSR